MAAKKTLTDKQKATLLALLTILLGSPLTIGKPKKGKPADDEDEDDADDEDEDGDEDEDDEDDEESDDADDADDEDEDGDEDEDDEDDEDEDDEEEEDPAEEAVDLTKAIVGKKGKPAVVKLLKAHGVDRVSKLKGKKLTAFIAAAKKLLGKK